MLKIVEIKAIIEVKSGLHIGGNKDEIKIGGIDNPVIKNPLTNEPYIPGSSLKGKMRTLLEWYFDTYNKENGEPTDINNNDNETAKKIVKLFGNGKTIKDESKAKEIGPTRLSFSDCYLIDESKRKLIERNALTEEKIEVKINRLTGSVGSGGPRHMERVPAGAEFNFSLSLIKFNNDEDFQGLVALGMKLIELTNLGGSGSRGYGKIIFKNIKGLNEKYLENGKLKKLEELEKLVGNN